MSALAGLPESKPSRRKRAAKTVDRALRGGILAAAVATVGWLLGTAVLGTAIIAMVVATIGGGGYARPRGGKARLRLLGLLRTGLGDRAVPALGGGRARGLLGGPA